ncbi:MAG: type II toxin-antitoxin system HicB family antitoxin [Spirochaetaceae bacterium]|nr:MAG: type II toxin-antitoxin system HicB family antitoxin [Spirochaetaceae bacterium]
MTRTFTAIVQRENDIFLSLCPELDIASQGATIPEARENLREAITLFLEEAAASEITERLHGEQYVSTIEVAIG